MIARGEGQGLPGIYTREKPGLSGARANGRARLVGQGEGAANTGGRRAAGELEAAALAVLQSAGSALTPAQVRAKLGSDLAYTTVVTILSRLHAKGVLTRIRSGRAYSYAPVADEPGLAARRMRGVLEAEADREAVLARFVSGLSPDDEHVLRRMLADQRSQEA